MRAVLERPMLVNEDQAAFDAWLASREITVLADKSLPYAVLKKVMWTSAGGRLRQDFTGRHRGGAAAHGAAPATV